MEESSLSKCGLDNMDLHQVKFAGTSFFKTALKGVDMSDCDMDKNHHIRRQGGTERCCAQYVAGHSLRKADGEL